MQSHFLHKAIIAYQMAVIVFTLRCILSDVMLMKFEDKKSINCQKPLMINNHNKSLILTALLLHTEVPTMNQ